MTPIGGCFRPGCAATVFAPSPPDPQTVGLYLAACADESSRGARPLSVATLERRLSGVCWHYRQLGEPLDSRDRHIATVLAGIRRRHARPPVQKEAIYADELLAMLAMLDMDLRGLRDRAILALASPAACGGPRSSASTVGPGGAKTEPAGSKSSKAARSFRSMARPVGARSKSAAAPSGHLPRRLVEAWMRLGRIAHGPLFRPIARKNGGVAAERLTDKHVARLVQKTAMRAGIRGDLTEAERKKAFGGHSLRAGLASSAQIEEAHVQKHLGHASAEMTRRYQRKRDRFKVNLTKAAGL